MRARLCGQAYFTMLEIISVYLQFGLFDGERSMFNRRQHLFAIRRTIAVEHTPEKRLPCKTGALNSETLDLLLFAREEHVEYLPL